MNALATILQARDTAFDPGAFDSGRCDDALERFDLPPAHRQLVRETNGFYAFDRALHVYGCAADVPFHDLAERNTTIWRAPYGGAADRLTVFAEDVFGNQYAYADHRIVMFDLETGEASVVAAGFLDWLNYVASDTDYATGRSLVRNWSATHGPLSFGRHLCPRHPFIAGGAYEASNLFDVSWTESLALRGDIARQIRDLPDGTQVVIRTTP